MARVNINAGGIARSFIMSPLVAQFRPEFMVIGTSSESENSVVAQIDETNPPSSIIFYSAHAIPHLLDLHYVGLLAVRCRLDFSVATRQCELSVAAGSALQLESVEIRRPSS
jgi:hypothetical protein